MGLYKRLKNLFLDYVNAHYIKFHFDFIDTHKNTHTIIDYLQYIKSLVDSLQVISHPISNNVLVLQILYGFSLNF